MKIRRVIAMAATAIIAAMTVNAQFARLQNYSDGLFSDVAKNEWYASEVSSAYELGFMNGISDNIFSPDGKVSVAQAITVASRVNAVYNGETIPDGNGESWYSRYVAYALEKKIITDGQFESYGRNIKRSEMAELFYDAMPENYFTKINNVTRIPDVASSLPYYQKLLTLYNAGVVMGSDDYGSFRPDSDIKRSEAAAIINRVAISENRIKGELAQDNRIDAHLLCANSSFDNVKEGISSGWTLDNQGGIPRSDLHESYSTLNDISTEYGTALIRHFNLVEGGRITTDTGVTLYGNGGSLEFRDKDDKSVYKLSLIDNSWQILCQNGTYAVISKDAFNGSDGKYDFRIITDLDRKTSTTYINDVNCGTYPLLSDNILNFRFATDEKSTTVLAPASVNMTVNYALNENFDRFGTKEVYGWKTSGNVYTVVNTQGGTDGELVLDGASSVVKTFEPVSYKSVFEAYVILPDGEDTKLSLSGGENGILNISSVGGELFANGEKLYDITNNMWYRLRAELNSDSGKADIFLDGRRLATVSLQSSAYADKLTIESTSGKARFDNIKVYTVLDHADYVPEPENRANLEDYIVGLNVCPLWKNGVLFGWSCITPYAEHEPLLGYYDEGNPESADWEIKYLVENGVDFQAFCWYTNNTTGPIKSPNFVDHLHDGYMYAKYSDYMKYTLIWETYGGYHYDSAQFRNYVVPYLFENYFLDDRYLKIDNKIVFPIYAPSTLAQSDYFGSTDGVKAELDYLTQTAKSYGYDGFIFMANDKSGETFKQMGFDASWAYHWGKDGYKFEVNRDNILDSEKFEGMHTIPTLSVGFDGRPWYGGNRSPMMTVEDYDKTSKWITNEYLPKYSESSDDWQSKFVMLSTWNEYGEGTFIMPSGLNGFGYLDTIRNNFTSLPAGHENLVPDESQKKRITYLYPQYHTLLRRYGFYNASDMSQSDKDSLTEIASFVPEKDKVRLEHSDFVSFENENFTAFATDFDPILTFLYDYSGINLDDVDIIAIPIKGINGSKATIYFDTVENPGLDAQKMFSFTIDSNELKTYYINTADNPLFTGTLATLRVDPFEVNNTQYTVGTARFLHSEVTEQVEKPTLCINGIAVESLVDCDIWNTIPYFPFDPDTGVDFRLNSYTSWSRYDNVLDISANHHRVVYTVGSDKYTVDGKEQNLGYTLYLKDGLPMIDFTVLCDTLGYEYTKSGSELDIRTNQYDIVREMNGALPEDPEGFEFNGYTSEGWSSSNVALHITGNSLMVTGQTNNYDPSMSYKSGVLSFAAKKYSSVKIRCRYSYTSDMPKDMQLFFTTSKDGSISEDKSLRIPFTSTDSKGEWEIYTYDLSSLSTWKDYITGLRFDPFNAFGSMEIDYIKFVQTEGYLYVDPESVPFEIVGGDAENIDEDNNPFYGTHGTVSVVKDAAGTWNSENHVYLLTGKVGQYWSFIKQDVFFREGKTYHIEFDAKVVSDCNGKTDISTDIVCDLIYPDASSSKNPDHIIGMKNNVTPKSGWIHLEFDYTVEQVDEKYNHAFGIYCSPIGDSSAVFMVDNIVVTEE